MKTSYIKKSKSSTPRYTAVGVGRRSDEDA